MAGTINENDMYTLLSQVFKPEVANTLLQQLKGETKPAPIVDRVMPGDLITAELMNQVIHTLQNLNERLTHLEGKTPTAARPVKITQILPAGALHVGDEVVIEGENFDFSAGGAAVFFGSEPVAAFKPGSRDDHLVVAVPSFKTTVPEAGVQVLVTVSNSSSTDYRSVIVLPPQIILYGSVLVTPDTVAPDPPVAGKAALFGYKITSAASTKADFTVSVLLAESGKPLDSASYDNLMTVLGKDKKTPLTDRSILLEPGVPTAVYVRVDQLPFADQTSFDLMVSLSAPGVKGDSMVKTYTVGQENNDDSFVALELINYDHTDWVAGGVATIPANNALLASMTLKLTDAAVKAKVLAADCDISISLQEGSGWTLLLLEPIPGGMKTDGTCTLTVGADGKTPVPVNLRYAIVAQGSPTVPARFELTVVRQDQAGTEKIKKTGLSLALPAVP